MFLRPTYMHTHMRAQHCPGRWAHVCMPCYYEGPQLLSESGSTEENLPGKEVN